MAVDTQSVTEKILGELFCIFVLNFSSSFMEYLFLRQSARNNKSFFNFLISLGLRHHYRRQYRRCSLPDFQGQGVEVGE